MNIGLNVKMFICDQGSNNRSAFDQLKVSEKNPFFTVNGKKIFIMYDPPHLIKNIRNNLLQTDLTVGSHSVSWNYIKEFYEFDSKMSINLGL